MTNLTQPPAGIRRLFERTYRAIGSLAPATWQRVRDPEATETFLAICHSSYARGGLPSFIFTAILECAHLLWLIARVRVGLEPRLASPRRSGLARDARKPWVVNPWRDVKLAWRSLVAGGSTSAIAITTLALGIGVNAAVFSVLDSVLFRQVPFRDAARLVELSNFSAAQKMSYTGFSRGLILEWREQRDLFDSVQAFDRTSFVFSTPVGTEMVSGAVVTPATFAMLGVDAQIGRVFAPGDGRGGTARRAVISDAFWRRRLAGALPVIGQTLSLNGDRYEIVGVMPASFRFPSGLQEVWAPYDLDAPPAEIAAPRVFTLTARLAPTIAPPAALAAVRERGERLGRSAGGPPGISAELEALGQGVDQRTERSLWILCGAVGFLFLIVCANVANLVLSRSLARARDLATYAALGATPSDLVRAVAIEHALLAGLGASGGLAVAALALKATVAALPDTMVAGTLNAIDLDARAIVFMTIAGAAAALLFGVPAALVAGRTSAMAAIGRDSRTSASGSRYASRVRGALAVIEVAVSIVLLVGSALMARSFVKLAIADPGFDTRGLMSVRVGLPSVGYSDARVRDQASADLLDRLRHIGGISDATVGGLPSDTGAIVMGAVTVDDQPTPQVEQLIVPLHEVPADYFAVMKLPLRDGRTFRNDDAPNVIVVNEPFARRFWPQGRVVGRMVQIGRGPRRTVIGVAAATTSASDDGTRRFEWYCPIGAATDVFRPTSSSTTFADFRTFVVRTAQPEAVAAALVGAIHTFDPSIVVWKIALVDHLLADAIARPRIVFVMMTIFAGFGLLLSMAGLYGVLSCLVSQRRREIGVRLALGASPGQMRQLVLYRGLVLTAVGVVIGFAAAVPLVGMMRTLLYDVNPGDPFAIVAAAAVLTITALFACWWPARRAMRIDPVELLRGE